MFLQARMRGSIGVIPAFEQQNQFGVITMNNGLIVHFEPNMRLKFKSIGRPGAGEHPDGTKFVGVCDDKHREAIKKHPQYGSLFWEISEEEAQPESVVPDVAPPNMVSLKDFIALVKRKKGLKPKAAAEFVHKHIDVATETRGELWFPRDRVQSLIGA